MADDGESPNDPQKTANLARIRDNQRRSRARRKDYLADLESKYRNCEQVGVAASAEIQTAAKNVVEENRRLRGLLKAYGIPDAEIDGVSGQQGPVAADTLEAMVNSRRPCGPGSECQSASQTVTSSRQVQPALSTQGQTQPTLPPNIAPRPIQQEAQFNGSTQPYMGQIPSPVSLTGAENPLSSAPTPPMATGAIHHPAFELPSGEHFAFSNGFHGQVMSQNAPQAHPQNEGSSSCQIAAENIRIFSPEAGYELEKQLGCRIPGQDCAVPNLKIFSVLDSYTGGSC